MRGTVTTKKVNEASLWLAQINAKEKELRFIIGKRGTSVDIYFHLRSEKIYRTFKKLLINKEKEILLRGWDIGYERISFNSKDISIVALPSNYGACIELMFRFYIFDNAINDIESRVEIIQKTLQFFSDNISELKVAMDIEYSTEKVLKAEREEFERELVKIGYEEKMTSKGDYRKFEVQNRHNVTSNVVLSNVKKYVNADIRISVDNIVVEEDNLSCELVYSLYYYVLEYYMLHFALISSVDKEYMESNNKFYSKLNAKI